MHVFTYQWFFSNLNSNCSDLFDLRNIQEQIEKTFCYQTFHCLKKKNGSNFLSQIGIDHIFFQSCNDGLFQHYWLVINQEIARAFLSSFFSYRATKGYSFDSQASTVMIRQGPPVALQLSSFTQNKVASFKNN